MSLFGQVWVYSLAAFFLGVLLTWLILVRPLRTRVRELERRVVAHRSELVTAGAETPPQREGWISDTAEADAAFAELDAVLPTAEGPEGVADSEWDAGPQWDAEPDPSHASGGYPAETAPVTEQGSSWVVPGVQGEWFTPADEDDPAPGDREDAAGEGPASISAALEQDETPDSRVGPPMSSQAEPSRGLFQPALPNTAAADEPAAGDDGRALEVPGAGEPSVGEPSVDEPGGGEPGADDEPAGSTLPKRQRREAPAGGFTPPEPIQPSMRPMTRREPTQPGRHSGSLFEPGAAGALGESAVPGESVDDASPSEPGSASDEDDGPVGPFGHGSAMPLPGGGKPSEAFTVKASVTTLRYCMPESPSFPEMVAEVWFRTAQDAERVGFRPIG